MFVVFLFQSIDLTLLGFVPCMLVSNGIPLGVVLILELAYGSPLFVISLFQSVDLTLQILICIFSGRALLVQLSLRYIIFFITTMAPKSRSGHEAGGREDGAGQQRGGHEAFQFPSGDPAAPCGMAAADEFGAHHIAVSSGVPHDFVDLIHNAFPFPCVYTSLVFGLRTEICPRPSFPLTPDRRYICAL